MRVQGKNKKTVKEAIAVYNPSDPWEKAIQDASKHVTGSWLPSHPCQLLAKAVGSLKCTDNWMERPDLFDIRAHYLFEPHMTQNKQERVFVTHMLFLRDILENREIDTVLHGPISFMTCPIANFLFRSIPVHIHVNEDVLRASNPKADFLDVGGFLIAQKGNVSLEDGVVADIRYYGEQNKESVESTICQIRDKSGLRFMKAASIEIAPDVFEIGEHERDVKPDSQVWDKTTREKARISQIDPGENGIIYLIYEEGNEKSVPKQEFDEQFVVI